MEYGLVSRLHVRPLNTRFAFKTRLISRLSLSVVLTVCLFSAAPVLAHVMSLSNGELRVEGTRAEYELRMPLYEIVHLEEPRKTLLENFHVRSKGRKAEPEKATCEEDKAGGWYVCRAQFQFPEPIDELDVECRFAAVTVPNHVHLLRAERGEITKQAVFDFSFTRTTINFVPPTSAEVAWSEVGAGLTRVIAGPMQILFILGLALAGRSRKELLWLAAAFLLAESASAILVAANSWQPPARFLEAAGALTVAYLAVEVLLLPEAGYRWMVAAAMGVFHGFYFGSFLDQSEMDPFFVLAGVSLAEVVLLVIFALLISRIERGLPRLRPVRAGAATLFAVGMVWFLLRLQS